MEWFEQNAWAAWVGLALALGAVEAATVDFIFIMLAGGAAAGGGAAALGAPFPIQVVTATIVALALLVLVRPEVKKRLLRSAPEALWGANSYVGRPAAVIQEVTPDRGRISIGGEEWSARLAADGPAVPPGARVYVTSIEGATAVVRPGDVPPPYPPSLGE